MGIKLKFASVAHPNTNGQKANGLICNGIKKRLLAPLEKAKHAWVDKLPSVLGSTRQYDPLNPEHEATGWVLWVNSTICVNMFLLFHSGAPTLESYEIK
jgi:hypothetical protein